jgi:Uma2 family endonuclease
LRRNRIGKAVLGLGVIFDNFNGVIPDLIFISNDRFDRILVNGRLKAAPEIVIEIVSPGTETEQRDRVAKRKLFSRTGASEYWILDPETRTIELYRKRKEGGFGRSITLQAEDDLTSPLLPDFRVPVGSLFE